MAGSISVIVPTFNRSAYLAEAIEAIERQTRPVSEIIVWDDGSSDATPALMQEMAAAGRIRAFRAENGGKSKALNAAMQHATGDYIWICDDDDLARPEAAERLAGMLDDSEAGVAAGCYARFRDDPETGIRSVQSAGYWPDLSGGSVLRHLLEDIFLFQNATLVRRAAYARVGGFREDLPRSIDYDMIARLAARFPIDVTEEILFDQRKHDGARGPKGQQHAESEVERVWLANDRRVFENLRPTLPLSLYAAMFEAPSAALAERAGLLQRATVYARRDDWPATLSDLQAAARLDAGPLTATEWAICRRALQGKHPVSIGLSAEVRAGLADIARTGPVGRMICRGYIRGILWRFRRALKRRESAMALKIAQFALGSGGGAMVIADIANPPALPDHVKERRYLPSVAYEWS